MRARVAAILMAAPGCGADGVPSPDAALPEPPVYPEGGAPLDGAPPAFADFTATGCALSHDGATCAGPAPLTVTLVPVATSAARSYEWEFGDGSKPSFEETPVHTYALPGEYDVTLTVVGPGGSGTHTRPGFVHATPVATGGPCDQDTQCLWGLCVCGDDEPGCDVPLDRGLCSFDCAASACAAGEVCVDLALGGGDEPWRRRLCLPSCRDDGDCARPAFACADLPARDALDGWARACFPPLVAPLGGACADATGEPSDARCAGGRCLPAGALGLCAADCGERPCPEGAACAAVTPEAAPLCLAACDGFACDGDPLLGCELPDPGGEWGFATTEGDDAAYCAPRRCETDGECAPLGACDLAAGGFCARAG